MRGDGYSHPGKDRIITDTLKIRLESIHNRIQDAARSCGRPPESIRLVAVSKTASLNQVLEAIDAGVQILGENYVQEAKKKISEVHHPRVSWHLIGHLQSNKAKAAVMLFDLIHTVDDFQLALELDRQSGKIGKIQKILIQVNISGEKSKSGASPDTVFGLADSICALKNLKLCGLMTIPPFFDSTELARPYFRALRELRDRLRIETRERAPLEELSMGMSGDFETAVQEGATFVRIGTAIFGERK